jgi:hypothetical protein
MQHSTNTSSIQHSKIQETISLDREPYPFVAKCKSQWFDTLYAMEAERAAPPDMIKTLRSYIDQGITFTFKAGPPPPRHLLNTTAVMRNLPFVRSRLSELIALGAIQKVPTGVDCPYIQPLHVILRHKVLPDGRRQDHKPRLVLDLSRNFNDYSPDEFLVYESLQSACRLLSPDCFMAKIDLADCYFAFEINKQFYQYFVFELDGVRYRFVRLIMGLKTAPALVTNLLSVVSFKLTKAGIRHARYLDDFLFTAILKELLHTQFQEACQIFLSFGLTLNLGKLVWPTQILEFLGIIIDSVRGVFMISQERRAELTALVQGCIGRHTMKVVEVMSLAGKLSFVAQILYASRPFLRALFDLLQSAGPKHFYVTLTSQLKSDLRLWLECVDSWNGRREWYPRFAFGISSDASRGGFSFALHTLQATFPRSFADLAPPSTACVGFFSQSDLIAIQNPSLSISFPELFSLYAALSWGGPTFSNCSIFYVTDNEANVGIINKFATASPVVAPLVRAIAILCTIFNIYLRAVHVSGELLKSSCDFWSRPELHKFQPKNFVGLSSSPHLPYDSKVCETFWWYSDQARARASTWPQVSALSAIFSTWLTPHPPKLATQHTTKSSTHSARAML